MHWLMAVARSHGMALCWQHARSTSRMGALSGSGGRASSSTCSSSSRLVSAHACCPSKKSGSSLLAWTQHSSCLAIAMRG